MHLHPPAILDRKLRFALAGSDRMAANPMDAIERHAERAEWVAVCDSDAAAQAPATAWPALHLRAAAPGAAA